MKSEIKKGDRVRINEECRGVKAGATGEVLNAKQGLLWVRIDEECRGMRKIECAGEVGYMSGDLSHKWKICATVHKEHVEAI